jgi:hypothetical protein
VKGGRSQAIREATDRIFTPRTILVAGWAIFVVYSFPGYMSYDSVWQLVQARHLEPRNDWQPPVMAVLWHYTDLFIAGPFPMLVIQSTTFLLGVASLLRRVMSERTAAVVAVLLLISPQNLVVMGVVWRHCQMAGFLCAGAAALLSPSRRWRLVGYFFLFMATAVCCSAPAAVLPITVLLFGWQRAMPPWRRHLLGTAAWIGITLAAFIVNSLLTEKKSFPWQNASATVDIVGIVRYAAQLQNDDLLRDSPGVPWVYTDRIRVRVRKMYTPRVTFLDVTQGAGKLIEPPATEAERDATTAAWKTLVFKHPQAFLRHRMGVFLAQIESRTGGADGFWAKFTNADWGQDALHHRASHGWLQQCWIDSMVVFDRWFGCRVRVYLWVALALLPMCRRDRQALALLASGILHELSLFLVAPAIEYRYSHWLVVTTMVGAILLFVTRLRPPRASPGLALARDLR